MDTDARLVSRILWEKDVDSALKRGVVESMVSPGQYRDAYRYICSHMGKYGQVPSANTVKHEFSGIRILKVDDDLSVVIDQFLEEYRRTALREMVQNAVDTMSKRRWDPDDVLAEVARTIEGLNSGFSSTEIDLMTTGSERLNDYDTRKNAPGGLLGIATGFPTIDAATLGLQPQQLVTIVATPKAGKSQLAMRMARTVHDAGYTPAFLSFEMSNDEQARRYDALAFGLSHLRLLNGDLVASEERKYRDGIARLSGAHPFYLLDSTSGMTVSAVAAKARALKPDVLFIDGVYLMIDEVTGEQGSPQALTNITRSLKRLAQKLNIPIVITTQVLTWKMRKNKLDPNSIGYSSSFYQDSDVIFGLERGDEELGDTYRLLKVLASRNTGGAEVELEWDWDSGRFEEVTATTGYGYP